MGIVVTVPHAKKPDSDPSAVAFTKQLESIMDIRDIPNYILYGNSPRNMLDLSTSEARGTGYNSDLASALRVASLLLEVHDFDSASDPTFEEDFVFVEIAKCDTEVIDQALAITNNFANVVFPVHSGPNKTIFKQVFSLCIFLPMIYTPLQQ